MANPLRHVSEQVHEDFEIALSTHELGALCVHLELAPPVPLRGTELLWSADMERDECLSRALRQLEGTPLVSVRSDGSMEVESRLHAALALIASPEVLISAQRQDPGWAASCDIGIAGDAAVEYRTISADEHRLALFPARSALDRIIGFCGLVERPQFASDALSITAAQFLAVAERIHANDVIGAELLLTGSGTAASRQAFTRALADQQAAFQVTVTFESAPGVLEGTTTGWVDSGPSGLWRIPAPAVSWPWEGDSIDEEELQRVIFTVTPATPAGLLEEIAEAVPGLVAPTAPHVGAEMPDP